MSAQQDQSRPGVFDEESIKFVKNLRGLLMRAIALELAADGYTKSREGQLSITLNYPDYFDEKTGADSDPTVVISLYSYVLGNGRHHAWEGATLMEAANKLSRDIRNWTAEAEDSFRETFDAVPPDTLEEVTHFVVGKPV